MLCGEPTERGGPRRYLRLEAEDRFVWDELDGERNVVALAKAYTRRFGTMGLFRVQQTVDLLAAAGMVDGVATDRFYGPTATVVARRGLAGKLATFNRTVLYRQVTVPGFAASIRASYRVVGRLLTSRVALVVLAVVAGWGFWRWWSIEHPRVAELSPRQIGWTVGAALLSLYAHELAHGWATLRCGHRVHRAGLLVVFGTPGAFVDTSDLWLAPRRQRIAVTGAGAVANLLLAAGAVAMARRTGSQTWAAVASGQYLLVAANATPLLKLDGYYALMDTVGVANLRERSLVYLTGGFGRAWRRAWSEGDLLPRLGREERILALYGVAMALWLVGVGVAGMLVLPERTYETIAFAWQVRNLHWAAPAVAFALLEMTVLGLVQLYAARQQVRQLAAEVGRRVERSSGAGALALVTALVVIGGAAVPNLAGTRSVHAERLWGSLVPLAVCLLAVIRGTAAVRATRSSHWRTVAAVGVVACAGLGVAEALDLGGLDHTAAPLRALAAVAVLAVLGWRWRELLSSLRGDLRAAWLPVLVGAALLVVPAAPDHVGALAVASGLVVAARLLARPHVRGSAPADIPARTTPSAAQLAGHLQRGFAFLAERIPQQIGELFGEAERVRFLSAANAAAVDAGWVLWFVEGGQLVDRTTGGVGERGAVYGGALARFVELAGQQSDPEVALQAVAEARLALPDRLGVLVDECLGDALVGLGRPTLAIDPADPTAPGRFALRHLVNVPIDAAAGTVGHLAIERVVGDTNRIASTAGWGLWCRANGQLVDDPIEGREPAAERGRNFLAVLYANLARAVGETHVKRSVQQALDTISVELRPEAAALVAGLPWAAPPAPRTLPDRPIDAWPIAAPSGVAAADVGAAWPIPAAVSTQRPDDACAHGCAAVASSSRST